MRTPTAGSRLSLGAWLFRGLGTYLVLESLPFLMLGLALKKTAAELAGPYLACATPAAILLPLVWWLKRWEEQGASTKRLARRWGASMALSGVAVVVAVTYSGVKLGFMDPKNALGGLVVSVSLCAPILYFTLHHMVLTSISSRAAGKPDSPRPK